MRKNLPKTWETEYRRCYLPALALTVKLVADFVFIPLFICSLLFRFLKKLKLIKIKKKKLS